MKKCARVIFKSLLFTTIKKSEKSPWSKSQHLNCDPWKMTPDLKSEHKKAQPENHHDLNLKSRDQNPHQPKHQKPHFHPQHPFIYDQDQRFTHSIYQHQKPLKSYFLTDTIAIAHWVTDFDTLSKNLTPPTQITPTSSIYTKHSTLTHPLKLYNKTL